jgi:hypothetical protein
MSARLKFQNNGCDGVGAAAAAGDDDDDDDNSHLIKNIKSQYT